MYALGLLVSAAAFLLALKAHRGVTEIQAQLTKYSAALGLLEAEVARLRKHPLDPASPKPASDDPPEPLSVEVVAPEADPLPAIVPRSPMAVEATPEVPKATLEEWLGTRWAVWVGGLALALGGLLLVRYTIEQGLIGPGVRIALGGLFSLALIVAGEWSRRSEIRSPVEAIPSAHVPGILTAAGTVSAFGTVYAAHALYDFIGPAVAFVLLGSIGVSTMLAAALHGPALAGLGLAGSLVAPMLVSTPAPNPWPLVDYLAAVAAAAYALARLRRWLWLAVAVVVGALVWGLGIHAEAATGRGDWSSALFVHVGLQLALAAVFLAIEPYLATTDDRATPDWIATASLTMLSALVVLALAATPRDAEWSLFAVAAMAILTVTAGRSAPASSAAPLAGLVALGALAVWPGLGAPPEPQLLAPAVAGVLRLPDNVSSFLTFAALATLPIAVLAAGRVWRGPVLPLSTAGFYLLAAIAIPVLALILAYLRVTQFDRSISFTLFAIVLSGLFFAAAYSFSAIAVVVRTPATRLAIGAFAAGIAAAVTLAFVMALDRGYLTVAFAVAGLTTALVAVAERISLLRSVVVALGLIVLGRLVWDPRIMGTDLGTTPIVNWLLFGYGVPAVAFLGAGRVLKHDGEDLAVRICDALGVVFAALLVFFEIRHLLSGGDPLAPASGHIEQGLLALMGFGFSYVLMRSDIGRPNLGFRAASLIFTVISTAFVVLGLGVLENPLFFNDRIYGAPVFSSLLLAYLLSGAAAVLLARASHGLRPAWFVTGIAVLAILLLFGYVTLEVRHVFQGEHIAIWNAAGAPEIWSYSVAWLMLGLVFLGYGIWRTSKEARLASAALVVLSVAKVFLYDLSGITGLWRALSFICLGIVLIGIGLVYQKLIFARPLGSPAS
jgi:uncharacterized membrane protein